MHLPIGILYIVALTGSAGPESPVELVKAYEKAANEHDVETVLSLMADNARMDFGPMGLVVGQDQIRGVHEYDRALNTQIRFEDVRAEGNQVTCRVVESNDWLRTAGIDELVFLQSIFELDESGLITSVTATMAPASAGLLQERLGLFDAWARAHQPEEYSALFRKDGGFDFSFDNGVAVLALLEQWRESNRWVTLRLPVR